MRRGTPTTGSASSPTTGASCFTVFDLDAFGSPWEQALILAARRPVAPGERIGLVLTEGSQLKTRFGGLPLAMRIAAGMAPEADLGLGRMHDEMIARALRGVVRRMGARVVKEWAARGFTGAGMRYHGAVLEGTRQSG
jgi:hypothetical protein